MWRINRIFWNTAPTLIGLLVTSINQLIGWSIVAVGLTAALTEVLWNLRPNLPWRRKVFPLTLFVVSCLGVGASLILYFVVRAPAEAHQVAASAPARAPALAAHDKAPPQPDGIEWLWTENGHEISWLGMTGSATTPAIIQSFQLAGINHGPPIEEIGGYIRSLVTGQKLPILLNVDGEAVPPSQTHGIPSGAKFGLVAYFDERGQAGHGMYARQFTNEWNSFEVAFDYDGKHWSRTFTEPEIAAQVARFEDETKPPPPKVKKAAPSGGGGGASRTDEAVVAGRGGDGQFWGAGGGGGGGLRVNPDGSIEAGGGGGGGGITEGGRGGGELGGGGGGSPGFPPGYFETDAGKINLLTWQMTQEYKAESGTDDLPPDEWANAWLSKRGVNFTYERRDNGYYMRPKA